MNGKEKKTFLLAATGALSLVIVGALATGQLGASNPAEAAHELPPGLQASSIGDGGLELSSVRLAAESGNFRVWAANDRSKNICVVAMATLTGNASAYCASNEILVSRGISGSMLVGPAEQGDAGATVLQTYLLPESADILIAAEAIPGAEIFDRLLVRYGPMDLERTTVITIPGFPADVSLQVFGRDSL